MRFNGHSSARDCMEIKKERHVAYKIEKDSWEKLMD